MEIRLSIKGLDKTLFFIPHNVYEKNVLEDFAHMGQPLTAVIKKAVGYKRPHLEIRKETGK